MTIKDMNVSELREYENNPRHNDHAVDKVAASIQEFGFKVPIIIDRNNVIVAGHTRLKAAKQLHMETVPCIVADDLTPEQIKAFRLADNKVSEFAEWNEDLLLQELESIELDMEQFGFIEEDDAGDDEEITKELPQIEFTESLEEKHNYIVLYFTNEIDWLQAQSLFDIKTVKSLSARKDGKTRQSTTMMGLGRVLNGAKALNKLLGEDKHEDQPELSEL